MKTGRWKGDGGEKHFGNKARQWFARHLREKLEELRSQYRLTETEMETLAGRFISESERYVKWKDSDEFHGRGFANGAWIINWRQVTSEIGELLREVRSDAARYAVPTLDDWLRADLSDSLEYSVAGGSAGLSKQLRKKLTDTARARRRRWPLGCIDCGAAFYREPKQRGKPIRCPECLRNHKWRRD